MKIEDLDVLRPEPRIIHLAGKDMDVSFIPVGITFAIDKCMRELSNIDKEEVLNNGSETEKAFELSIKMASLFCEHKYPEMDENWFRSNVDGIQLEAFVSAIKDALVKAYEGIKVDPKNSKAPKKTK